MKRRVPDGVKVKFFHNRSYEKDIPFVLPRGGSTECKLILEDGEEIVAHARCSERDNYSKKLGRDISLGRALALAEKQRPELFRKEITA
jgi:hypothetical protein